MNVIENEPNNPPHTYLRWVEPETTNSRKV